MMATFAGDGRRRFLFRKADTIRMAADIIFLIADGYFKS